MKKKVVSKKKSLALIFTIIILLSIITAVSISLVIYSYQYNTSVLTTAKVSSEQTIVQVNRSIDNYIKEIKNTILLNSELLEDKNFDEVKNIIKQIVYTREEIEAIVLYNEKGDILTYSSTGDFVKVPANENLSFFEKDFASLDKKEIFVSPPHVQNMIRDKYPWVITFAMKLYIDNVILYFTVEINFENLSKYIDGVGIGHEGYAYILDNQNNIIYHPKSGMINSGVQDENTDIIKNIYDKVIFDNDKVYVVKSLDNADWRIVGVSNIDSYKKDQMKNIVLGVIIMAVLGLVICFISLLAFRRYLYRPINELILDMKSFEKNLNEFSYTREGTVAEFDELGASFSHLATRVKNLIKKTADDEKELRKTELKALQSQINPHFLYNTLDSILWMSEQHKNEDVIEMVSSLAKLFRISISKGHELISIKNEVEHVESYLKIQSYRYKNKFKYNIHVDDNVMELMCNKITLQPFLENSIIHGMSPTDILNIDINIYKDNEYLYMDIIDDGVGMSEETLSKLLSDEMSNTRGIGVKNVDNRIKINFGDKYGVNIVSEEDYGTTVHILLPIITQDEVSKYEEKKSD